MVYITNMTTKIKQIIDDGWNILLEVCTKLPAAVHRFLLFYRATIYR